MGMSIENAITWLNTDDYESKGFADATSVAIDTMRKYQKIEELAEYHMLRFLPKERMSSFQKDILEVLEDGKID